MGKTNWRSNKASLVSGLFSILPAAAVLSALLLAAGRDPVAIAATGAGGAMADDVLPRLKAAYKGKFLFGTAVNYPALQGRDPAILATAEAHFSAFTPENSLKPDAVHRTEDIFTFTDADRLVEIAEKNGAVAVGHTLVWNQQTPAWFFRGADGKEAGRELVLERMRRHIAAVVGRYRGRIKQWDVVNEALSDSPNEDLKPSPWLKAIGPDYIEEAFRAAHKADPNAVLIYNDYQIERNYKRPKALRLLKSLLERGVPVHAVGMQCHWRLDSPDLAEVETSIEQFAALGLKVMITELDIGVLPSKYQGADLSAGRAVTPEVLAGVNPYIAGLPEDVARRHGERYRAAFELFLRHKKDIGRVTVWGIKDGASWLNNFPIRGRTDYPLLFDREGKPKPAFFEVRKAGFAAK